MTVDKSNWYLEILPEIQLLKLFENIIHTVRVSKNKAILARFSGFQIISPSCNTNHLYLIPDRKTGKYRLNNGYNEEHYSKMKR